MNVCLRPAVEQLELLRLRSISAAELAEEHIVRIQQFNPVLNAFVDFDETRVRAQVQHPLQGPLAGLPVSVKSSIQVAGQRCEIGSLLNAGAIAEADAASVRKLRRAGAVILGATNCPEFLMAYETDNLLHGETRNPWDLQRNAGGSSGGESAAIAAGLSAGGLGSDSGGSVREPAHFTGICSLKPTPGRISAVGHVPPCVGPFSSLGSIGPMARTIADVQLLFGAVHADTGPIRQVSPVSLAEARRATVAWFEQDELSPVTAETRAAVRTAAKELERAGFRVQQIAAPAYLQEAQRLWRVLFLQCGAMFYKSTLEGKRKALSPTFLDFLAEAEAETPLTAMSLLAAWAETDLLRERFQADTRDLPVLLTPVCAVPAFRSGERTWQIEGRDVGYWEAMRFTQWFNLLAAPAAVIPVGRSPEGLPIGVQVAGRPYEDELVLAVAGVLDRAFGYRAPSLAVHGTNTRS